MSSELHASYCGRCARSVDVRVLSFFRRRIWHEKQKKRKNSEQGSVYTSQCVPFLASFFRFSGDILCFVSFHNVNVLPQFLLCSTDLSFQMK